jgi:hypothetical protein
VVAPVGGWPVEQVFWAPALRQTCHSIKGKLLGVRAGPLLEYPIALLITWVGLKNSSFSKRFGTTTSYMFISYTYLLVKHIY